MSRKCPSLAGTEEYAYESNTNPPTDTQVRIIEEIERVLQIKFTGSTSRHAYKFIGDNYEKARRLNEGRYFR